MTFKFENLGKFEFLFENNLGSQIRNQVGGRISWSCLIHTILHNFCQKGNDDIYIHVILGVETFSLVYTLPATHLRPSHDSFMKLGGITTEYIAMIRLGTSLPNSSLPLFPDSRKISHSCTRVLIRRVDNNFHEHRVIATSTGVSSNDNFYEPKVRTRKSDNFSQCWNVMQYCEKSNIALSVYCNAITLWCWPLDLWWFSKSFSEQAQVVLAGISKQGRDLAKVIVLHDGP